MRYSNKQTGKRGRDLAALETGELKGFRLQLGLSLSQMSEKLGVSSRTLGALESGSRETRTTIARLAWYMVRYKEVKDRLNLILTRRISSEEEEQRVKRRKAWEEGEI